MGDFAVLALVSVYAARRLQQTLSRRLSGVHSRAERVAGGRRLRVPIVLT